MKIFFNNQLKKNLANIITLIGLGLAIWLLVIAINNPEQLWLIFLLGGIVAFTDLIDGRLAKHLDIKSDFGSFLDRLRDRVFIYPALIIFTWHHRWKLTDLPPAVNTLTIALVVGTLLMEVLLFIACCIGVIWYLEGTKIDLAPNNWGRKKTFSGFTVVLIWLLSLTATKYWEFPMIKFSIYVINLGLVLMLYWAYKSLEEYSQRGKEAKRQNKSSVKN